MDIYSDETYEDYYNKNEIEKYKKADAFMKAHLKNIRRISFHKYIDGQLPVFYLGETINGNNLIGLFSTGVFT